MIGAPFLYFIFGSIVGSFLNVVILRYNTGKSLAGRSGCFSCGKTLHWYELIPVLSFYLQKGRCRGCRSKISWQYPLVELATAFLFLFVGLVFGNNLPETLFWWVVVSILVVITSYDLRHQIIPDGMVYTLMVLGLFKPFFMTGTAFRIVSAWEDILAGVVLFLFFAGLWYFSGGRWMGFGDAKLALAVGFLLGFWGGLSAIVLAFWIGAAVGLALIGVSKSRFPRSWARWIAPHHRIFSIKSEVPFAPFIVVGFILSLIFNINVFYLF